MGGLNPVTLENMWILFEPAKYVFLKLRLRLSH